MQDKPLTPPRHKNIRPKTMCALNGLKPWKLEEQGDKLVSESQELLDRRGAELSQSKRQQAQETLA
jgi:hypothetical protein